VNRRQPAHRRIICNNLLQMQVYLAGRVANVLIRGSWPSLLNLIRVFQYPQVSAASFPAVDWRCLPARLD